MISNVPIPTSYSRQCTNQRFTVLQYIRVSKLHPDVTNNIISGAYPFLRAADPPYLLSCLFLGPLSLLATRTELRCRNVQSPRLELCAVAEPEVVRCRRRRRWTVVLRRCRDARSRRAAPHDLATSHDQFSVARSLPRWTSRRARCFHALTTLLVCLLPRCFHSN